MLDAMSAYSKRHTSTVLIRQMSLSNKRCIDESKGNLILTSHYQVYSVDFSVIPLLCDYEHLVPFC